MDIETRQKIQARIREIDEWLRNLPACEMTEGWLTYGPDMAEVAELYREREQLLQQLQQLAKAA